MTDSATLALWITGPRQAALRSETPASPADGEVVVRTRYGAVSRGTEGLVYRGEVPPSEYERMRAPHQAGRFPWPVKYGYISVGTVEHGPSALLGRSVFCLYPHQDRYVVAADDVLPIPEGTPAARAVLAANTETAINAVWDADVRIGDRVAVVGAGAIGCLVAWLASRIPGCEVELIDIDPGRAAVAAALGVNFARPEDARGDADRVVHASASESGLRRALELAGFEATVVELSWFGSRQPSVPLGGAFHSQRLSLRSSQVGQVSNSQRSRWTHRRRLALALDLLAEPCLDALITGESTFAALPDTLARLDDPRDRTICERVAYG